MANLAGRLVILAPGGAIDVERTSEGRFSAEPQAIYDRWADFTAWSAAVGLRGGKRFDPASLRAPAPAPRQVFGIGLNYREHVMESRLPVPEQLSVFTKFPSCITGPFGQVTLPPGGHTDWEVELVVVIGRLARNVSADAGWSHVAGLCAGQDISERITQLSGEAAQFSLGKSFPRFGPTGPWLVTPDEFANPDDLELVCSLNGDEMQRSRTSCLIVPVPQLIARLSATLPLLPGDVIFTGTPAGAGLGRDPQRWLAPGDELVSHVEGIGELRQRFIAGRGA